MNREETFQKAVKNDTEVEVRYLGEWHEAVISNYVIPGGIVSGLEVSFWIIDMPDPVTQENHVEIARENPDFWEVNDKVRFY